MSYSRNGIAERTSWLVSSSISPEPLGGGQRQAFRPPARPSCPGGISPCPCLLPNEGDRWHVPACSIFFAVARRSAFKRPPPQTARPVPPGDPWSRSSVFQRPALNSSPSVCSRMRFEIVLDVETSCAAAAGWASGRSGPPPHSPHPAGQPAGRMNSTAPFQFVPASASRRAAEQGLQIGAAGEARRVPFCSGCFFLPRCPRPENDGPRRRVLSIFR